jgi:hypothetical protein
MYANQRVQILGGRFMAYGAQHDEVLETLNAWQIEIAKTGRIRVYLDDPDGESDSYANPMGVRDLPLGTRVRISTDF